MSEQHAVKVYMLRSRSNRSFGFVALSDADAIVKAKKILGENGEDQGHLWLKERGEAEKPVCEVSL